MALSCIENFPLAFSYRLAMQMKDNPIFKQLDLLLGNIHPVRVGLEHIGSRVEKLIGEREPIFVCVSLSQLAKVGYFTHCFAVAHREKLVLVNPLVVKAETP